MPRGLAGEGELPGVYLVSRWMSLPAPSMSLPKPWAVAHPLATDNHNDAREQEHDEVG
jgi:hypothetical protein